MGAAPVDKPAGGAASQGPGAAGEAKTKGSDQVKIPASALSGHGGTPRSVQAKTPGGIGQASAGKPLSSLSPEAAAGSAQPAASATQAKSPAKNQAPIKQKAVSQRSVKSKPVRVIAVSSGKGGVGKSNLTLALGLALVDLGRKVLIWDADLGLANTDVLLGIRTKATIHDWLKGEKSLAEIIIKGPKGINILPAASGILELNEISESQKVRLIAEFEEWQDELDFLLIDTAAGIGPNVIFFNLVAQEHLIVLNNEPTSITDAYALIKALNTKHKQGSFYLLPNMVSGSKDARAVFELMSNVASQYLDQVSLDLAGYVPFDENVPAAVRRQQPFYILFPDCEASRRIADLARYLIGRESPVFGAGGLVLFLNRLVSAERAVD